MFGWTGAAPSAGTTGSTHRTSGGWQASWPMLGAVRVDEHRAVRAGFGPQHAVQRLLHVLPEPFEVPERDRERRVARRPRLDGDGLGEDGRVADQEDLGSRER